ncbi:hypothetical protein BH09VER1_BH09VER1_25590 [soil metagenome]
MRLRYKSRTKLISQPARGFTLLELLVCCVILIMVLGLVVNMMGSASNIWIRHRNQAKAFESANSAFAVLTKTVSQALLNTYWEVRGSKYARASELHFVMGPASGPWLTPVAGVDASRADLLAGNAANFPGDAVFFQAPLGRDTDNSLKRLPSLLNGTGYFICFSDAPDVPQILKSLNIVKSRYRYRLYQWMQPTENLMVYSGSSSTPAAERTWFHDDFANFNPVSSPVKNANVFAENVLGVILIAEYPDAAGNMVYSYAYDSRSLVEEATLNQLPPKIRVFMVVIDEASASRLADRYGTSPPDIYPPVGRFQDAANFKDDMSNWEAKLKATTPRVDYRILSATVSVQNAKWSL